MSLRIVNPDPTLGPAGFVFSRENGVRVSRFTPGYPEIREVSDYRPDQHGKVDYSRYFGESTCSIEFKVIPNQNSQGFSRRQILDTLRGLANPALRPYLYESIDDIAERRILLRPSEMSMPFELPHVSDVQMSWRCPDGVWESTHIEEYEIGASEGAADAEGREYPLVFPRFYPLSPIIGGSTVENQGNIETYPMIYLYGPCVDARIGNSTTQKYLSMEELNLDASEFVQINMKERTLLRNGDPNVEVYEKVDWTVSDWWSLGPGENVIAYLPTESGGTSIARILFRHNWI